MLKKYFDFKKQTRTDKSSVKFLFFYQNGSILKNADLSLSEQSFQNINKK